MYSDDHAEHTCALASLIASCDQHGLDPEFYLQEILTVAPSWPRSRVLELSPKFWVETRQRLIRDGALRYIDLARITGSQLVFRPN
jgi:transposase